LLLHPRDVEGVGEHEVNAVKSVAGGGIKQVHGVFRNPVFGNDGVVGGVRFAVAVGVGFNVVTLDGEPRGGGDDGDIGGAVENIKRDGVAANGGSYCEEC